MGRGTARYRRGARRTLATAGVVLFVLGAGVALAWTSSTQNPGSSITASTLPDPSGLTATKIAGGNPNRCANGVTVAWTLAPAPVNAQVLESRIDAGAWTTHAVAPTDTSFVDSRDLQGEITYRLKGAIASTSWTSPGIEQAIICGNGTGNVYDLAATASGCGVDLAWSAATNATTYDIRYSTDAGASWTTIVSNHGSTSYTATGIAGASVDFQVRPGIGGGNDGDWSNTATVTNLGFRVTSIAFSGDGDNNLEVGETITVTFNRAANPATPSGTGSTSITLKKNGGGAGRGLYIGSTNVDVATTAIGQLRQSSFTMAGNQATVAGSAAWSAGNTVWTWTRTAGGSLNLVIGGTEFIAGTSAANPARVQCSGGGDLGDSTVTVSGGF